MTTSLQATEWRLVWTDFDMGLSVERHVRFVRAGDGKKWWEIKKMHVQPAGGNEIVAHIVGEGQSISAHLGDALAATGYRPSDIDVGFLAGFAMGEAEAAR